MLSEYSYYVTSSYLYAVYSNAAMLSSLEFLWSIRASCTLSTMHFAAKDFMLFKFKLNAARNHILAVVTHLVHTYRWRCQVTNELCIPQNFHITTLTPSGGISLLTSF